MGEVLKRWNGSELVTVASVNRIEIGGGGSDGILNHPTYGRPKIPMSNVPSHNATDGLNINYTYSIE